MDEVEFGILGPLTARCAGRAIPLGPEKHRTLLACLLLRANQVVPVTELIDRLWGEDPPAGGRRVIQTYVTRLRKALGEAGELIRTRPPGYLIDLPDGALDLARFRAHGERARAAGALRTEAEELRAGLALWRGEPLSDINSEALRRDELPRLVEERMRALDRRIEVDLALGRHAELVGELSGLVREHPLRESLWSQLMLALHRSGRQADALQAYQDIRTLLRDELGLDPGAGLRAVHEAILRADAPPAEARPPVRQLPADTGTFVGRQDLVELISELTQPASSPAILVLSGPPGIGKTALAVHAAHRLAPDFPDGQLYVNLRGYSGSPPMPAGDALVRMLRALGVPPDLVPAELDEQSSLFRSTVADRKILMVLDNVISPDHVRPLLPGSPSCPVIITSRDDLRGLTAINDARRLPVGVLTADESMALLAGIAGASLITAEPVAAQRLAELCGRLPLALRIAAANLVGGPYRTVVEYVEHLSAGNRLGALEIDGDDQSAVRVAFELSYAMLKPDLARLFRLLSLVPGPDFDGYAAANLADLPLDTARTLLDRLATANLIADDGSGRYQFHDLIRDYAAALAEERHSSEERAAAHRRLLQFYCHTTDSVADLVYPEWHRLPIPALPGGAPRPSLDNVARCLSWLDEERANLVAAIRDSAQHTLDLRCPMAAALLGYFWTQRHDRDWLTSVATAVADAERAGDLRRQAAMRFGLGQYRFIVAEFGESEAELRRAATLYRECGDTLGEARAISSTAAVLQSQGKHAEGAERLERALAMQREIDDRAGECLTLFRLGLLHTNSGPLRRGVDELSRARVLSEELRFQSYALNMAYFRGRALIAAGDPTGAVADLEAALELSMKLRSVEGEADVLAALAEALVALGRVEEALELADRALALSRKVSARMCELLTLITLGTAQLRLGRPGDARAHLTAARALAEHVRVPLEAKRADTLLAACHRMRGDYQLALRTVPRATEPPEPWCGPGLAELARIRLAMGDAGAAVLHASAAVEISEGFGYGADGADARAVLAEATAKRG